MRPITMQVNYTLTNTAVPVFSDLEPVLDDYIPATVTAQVCIWIFDTLCLLIELRT